MQRENDSKVNGPTAKVGGFSQDYAANGLVEAEKFGKFTIALRPMFTAAMWSATPECPQATQENTL